MKVDFQQNTHIKHAIAYIGRIFVAFMIGKSLFMFPSMSTVAGLFSIRELQ